jgi:hypothetical protein
VFDQARDLSSDVEFELVSNERDGIGEDSSDGDFEDEAGRSSSEEMDIDDD